jgi:integrase/recombinase XerC
MKSSVARKLAALRTFFQFVVREGLLEMNPAKFSFDTATRKEIATASFHREAIKFIETPDVETDLGKRDRANVGVAVCDGRARVRIDEDGGWETWNFKNKLIRVTGKRRKERIVPFGDPRKKLYARTCAVRNDLLNNAPVSEREPDALFLNYQGTRNYYTIGGPDVGEKYIRICAGMHDISPART